MNFCLCVFATVIALAKNHPRVFCFYCFDWPEKRIVSTRMIVFGCFTDYSRNSTSLKLYGLVL